MDLISAYACREILVRMTYVSGIFRPAMKASPVVFDADVCCVRDCRSVRPTNRFDEESRQLRYDRVRHPLQLARAACKVEMHHAWAAEGIKGFHAELKGMWSGGHICGVLQVRVPRGRMDVVKTETSLLV